MTLFEEVLDNGLKEKIKNERMGEIFKFQNEIDKLKDKALTGVEVIKILDNFILTEKQLIDSEFMRFGSFLK